MANSWDVNDPTAISPSSNCAGWVWVDVINAAGFFSRGATTLTGDVSSSTCSGTFTLEYEDQNYSSVQEVTGTMVSGGSLLCQGGPQAVVSSAAALPTPTIRFGTQIVPSAVLDINASVPAPTPK